MKKNIILFGPPGSGKGTQSKHIVKQFSLKHLSTGDLFRENIKNKTPLGNKAQIYMNEGKLVPDEIVIDMLKTAVLEHQESIGFIFDGFPRTVPQAKTLDLFLSEINSDIGALISLEVEDKELIKRLLERGKVSNRPDDQDLEKITTRLNVYKSETQLVKEHYASKNKLHLINGVGEINEIFKNISHVIESL